MGLDFAVEQLVATGWSALDTRGCGRLDNGSVYPKIERVTSEFADAGLTLTVKHIQLFDCFRAEWVGPASSGPEGAVVGHTSEEAAVYALSQMRRSVAAAV